MDAQTNRAYAHKQRPTGHRRKTTMKTTTKRVRKSTSPTTTAPTTGPTAQAPAAAIATAVAAERNGHAVLQITRGPETVTSEAHRWLMDPNAIPAAMFAPIRFVGWETINKFSELVKRPLEIAEVQMLVQADGNQEICLIDGITFQPVRYVPFVPQEAERMLKADPAKKLSDVPMHYGGAFFQNDRIEEGRVVSISGCVYNSRGETANGSPLVITSVYLGKKMRKQRPLWGESRAHVEERMKQRAESKQEYKRRSSRVAEIFGGIKARPLQQPFAAIALK